MQNCVKIEELLHTVKDEGNILHAIKHLKANWNGHTLRKNYILQNVIEVKIEGRWN